MSPLTNITSLANEVNYGLNTPIYIVGGGSFAIKLANVFIDNQLEFEFIDECAPSLLLERNVYKAHSIPSPLGIFFIAISIDEYALAAISRLAQQGVKKEQCLPLKYDSDSIMLGHMFTHNRHKLLALLAQPLSSVKELESSFYVERSQFFESSSAQNNYLIGICCLGRGGGYLGHLGHIPTWLAAHHNTVMLSDTELDLQGKMPRFLMGQSAMNAETSLDLVITAHVFPCSPRQTKKLSFCHMIYDFLLFNQQTYEHLQQAQTHYVFLPSSASMKMHQDICLQNKFENNIVLIPGGYPRHDNNMRQYQEVCATQLPVDSILYAPTLSSLPAGNETYACYSIISALQFVPEILARFSDKKLIFRPHPEDLALIKYSLSHPRAQAFAELLAWCEQHPRCEI
ncbi:MAG: hypothetical protein ACRCT7_17015, partial [Shewanella sp.]